ncbi:MAG: glycosyltransferase family 39 protein [Thermoleophilia bacterium]
MGIAGRIIDSIAKNRLLQVLLLCMLVLAYTLPFIGQAIHIDAHLTLDWARQELIHPWWQHIPDYDYTGVHYNEFHDTHPRLYSLYLSLFLRIMGGVSVPVMHLGMIPFPIIATVSMYWLCRRFGFNAFIATLLLLIAPAFLVNSHLLMTDVAGISLWMAGLALFIAGVDRNRLVYLLLSAVPFSMTIFIYYQGLTVLALAFLYLLIHRKLNRKTVTALSIPVILFLAFVSAHVAYYGALPTVTYPDVVGLPLDPASILQRLIGVTTLVGGVAILPVLGVWLFPKSRPAFYIAAGVYFISMFWLAWTYLQGNTSLESMVLLPLFLSSGLAIIWYVVILFIRNLRPGLADREGGDSLWLSAWFLGTFFYCSVLMPYSSPRYMIPLLPPLAMFASRMIQKHWGSDRVRLVKPVTLIAVATLVLSLSIAVAENQRANTNPVAAEWVANNLGGSANSIWYNGGLGFEYYLQPFGYRMLIINSDEPAVGDIIVESVHGNRWPFRKEFAERLELEQTVDFNRTWPVTTESVKYHTSWLGQLGLMLPYGFSGDCIDRLYVYRVVREPGVPSGRLEEDSYSSKSDTGNSNSDAGSSADR